MDVDLYDRAGKRLGTYTIPPLRPAPDVILMGARVFVFSESNGPGNQQYHEGTAWLIEEGTAEAR